MEELQRLFRSFNYAFEGIYHTLIHEKNMQIHFLLAFFVSGLALWAQIPWWQYLFIIVLIGQVIAFELINTAIEAFCNGVTQTANPWIKKGKDAAAGAVLIAAIVAVIVGITILFKPLLGKVENLHNWLTELQVPTSIEMGIMFCVWILLLILLFQWDRKYNRTLFVFPLLFFIDYLFFFWTSSIVMQLFLLLIPIFIVIFLRRGLETFLGLFQVAVSFFGVYLFYYLVQ